MDLTSSYSGGLLLKYIKPRVLLNHALTSTYSHPAPSTSTQLISPSTQLSQCCYNQNIARNWAIFPNLGRKIPNCSFWRKIDTHGILKVLIPNPDLKFRSQNSFLGKFGSKKSKLSVLPEKWHTWYLEECWWFLFRH